MLVSDGGVECYVVLFVVVWGGEMFNLLFM